MFKHLHKATLPVQTISVQFIALQKDAWSFETRPPLINAEFPEGNSGRRVSPGPMPCALTYLAVICFRAITAEINSAVLLYCCFATNSKAVGRSVRSGA